MKLTHTYTSENIINITKKYVYTTDDNLPVEVMLVRRKEGKIILCLPTQIGCKQKCKFCTCCYKEFHRNLTFFEMTMLIKDTLDIENLSRKDDILISFMGTGEPLDNYVDFRETFLLHAENYKVAFSTSMPANGIRGFNMLEYDFKNITYKLQISLHGVHDGIRYNLMPNSLYIFRIQEMRAKLPSNVKVEWNYTPIKRRLWNSEAKSLSYIIPFGDRLKINKLSEIQYNDLKSPPIEQVNYFVSMCKFYGIDTEYYETDGGDIRGTCGMLGSELS